MIRHPHTAPEWGNLESVYTDEFGRVAPDIYACAGRLWQRAQLYASRFFTDNDIARIRTLLLKSAAKVTRIRDEKSQQINELDAYLFQTFKHVVLAEVEKEDNRRRFETAAYVNTELRGQAENVERRILLEELVSAMDPWTRNVFEWLTLDYTFNDIGLHLGLNPKVVRTKYHRRLARLMKQIEDL